MSRGPARVNESVIVPGSSAEAVLERVRIAVRSFEGYAVSSPTAMVVQFARTARSLGGRRTHTCTVTAVNEPHRLVVTIAGELDADHLVAIRAAITGRSTESARAMEVASFSRPATTPPPSSASGFQPPADWLVGGVPAAPVVPSPSSSPSVSGWAPPSDEQHTILRPSTPPVPSSVRHTAAPPVAVPTAWLTDGRRIRITGVALLGRHPSPRPEDGPAVELVAIDDEALSKTHLAIRHDAGRVWVEDRHSTNGTSVLDGLGRPVALPAGERTLVELPVTLLIGDGHVKLEWAS